MKNLRFRNLAATLTVIALAAGCSSDRISGPMGPAVAAGLSRASETRVIGPLGGTLSVDGVSLFVPAGAVGESIEFTMSKDGNGGVELGPHGLQFARPVSLSFDLPSGMDSGRARIEWYDPSSGSWVAISSVAAGIALKAPLQHFSKYRLTVPEDLN